MLDVGNMPDVILMNGQGPYGYSMSKSYEVFTVTKGNLHS